MLYFMLYSVLHTQKFSPGHNYRGRSRECLNVVALTLVCFIFLINLSLVLLFVFLTVILTFCHTFALAVSHTLTLLHTLFHT